MRKILVLLGLAVAFAAPISRADTSRYYFAGEINTVDSATPAGAAPFAVGEQISGWYDVNFSNATTLQTAPGSTAFFNLLDFSMLLGPVALTSNPNETYAFVTDGGAGNPDTLNIYAQFPYAQNDPRGSLLFPDLNLVFTNLSGSGFTQGSQSFDPSDFTQGKLLASPPSTSDLEFVGGDVELTGGPVSVPEPGALLLTLGGILGLAIANRKRLFESPSR